MVRVRKPCDTSRIHSFALSGGRDPPRHRILTFYDTLFQGILATDAADGAFLDYNSGGREGLQIGGVSSARFIRHY